MKKIIKQTPHSKDECLVEMKWYLLKLIDAKEITKLAIIGLISDHIKHLED